MPIVNWPGGEAPREKLVLRGSRALSDAELLAVLLRTGCRDSTVLDLARGLLERYGGLVGIFAAGADQLQREPGIGLAKYVQLQAAMELARRHALEDLARSDVLTSAPAQYGPWPPRPRCPAVRCAPGCRIGPGGSWG